MTIEELQARAKFIVQDTVYWRGSLYKVTARYWRRWNDSVVYDLNEIVPDSRTPRFQNKVREQDMQMPGPRDVFG